MASDTTLATVGLATKTSLSTLLSELRTRFIPSSLSPFNSSTTRLTPSLAPDTLWTSLDRSMQLNPSPPPLRHLCCSRPSRPRRPPTRHHHRFEIVHILLLLFFTATLRQGGNRSQPNEANGEAFPEERGPSSSLFLKKLIFILRVLASAAWASPLLAGAEREQSHYSPTAGWGWKGDWHNP